MGSTRRMWVGLDLCDGLGWIEFFLTHYGGLGQKIPSIRPNPAHAHPRKRSGVPGPLGPPITVRLNNLTKQKTNLSIAIHTLGMHLYY